MSTPYFRTIQTVNPSEEFARSVHEQKLNNYAIYKQPWTGEEAAKMNPPIVAPFEIKSHSTATCTKDYIFIITTTLCCEDKETEEYKA